MYLRILKNSLFSEGKNGSNPHVYCHSSPSDIEKALGKLAYSMRPAWPERGVRWVKAEHIHLTLRFLGNTEEERVGRIGKGLTVVAQEHEAFELALAGSGCFPNGWRPRVIWTGIADDAGRLVALQSDIEGVVRELGYEAEMRDYRPHLTLGRVRQDVKPQGD